METPTPKKNESLKKWILPFLLPTLVGKSLILFFGLNYSEMPGKGYGWGLVLSICFTLGMMGRFVWVNRNYED